MQLPLFILFYIYALKGFCPYLVSWIHNWFDVFAVNHSITSNLKLEYTCYCEQVSFSSALII